jgi:hypothetical protein
MTVRILEGDCRDILRTIPDESVHCVVTSPPYFGLRDYGVHGQMGLEATPDEFIAGMVAVFRECRRVLRDDGTLWLNVGDSYAGAPGGWQGKNGQRASRTFTARIDHDKRGNGCKSKDLIGVPWMLAFALRADGWFLRQDIIWSKPNPMPESVTDRCTKAHEYVFLLSKSARYYFDAQAVAEPRCRDVESIRRGVSARRAANRSVAAILARADNVTTNSRDSTATAHAQPAHRLDDRDATIPRRALRRLSAGAGRAVHPRRISERRHGPRSVRRCRHDGVSSPIAFSATRS